MVDLDAPPNRPAIAAGGVLAERPVFPLLRYFSLASLLAIAAVTVALTIAYEKLATRDLTKAQESHHVTLTLAAANTLWPRFARFIRSSADLDIGTLRSSPEIGQLQNAVIHQFAGTPVLKVKVYNLGGRTAFSTEATQIGEDKSKNAGFLSARAGTPASELTHRNQFSAFEQTVENVDVVSSYVPIREGGAVTAVFEIYSDISALLSQIRETRTTVIALVTGFLLALYAALFFIVRHANNVIRRQERQRQQGEDSLRQARAELVRSEEFHRALVERSSDAVVLLGADLNARYVTAPVARILGRAGASLIGSSLNACAREPHREAFAKWLKALAAATGPMPPVEFECDHPETGRRYLEGYATNLLSHPAVRGIVVNFRDITERKQAEQQVRYLALYDGLTGLSKRELFAEQARKAFAMAKRFQEHLAILFLDLDGFKRINDTLGHDAGDTLLKELAARLRDTLREGDTIGRQVINKPEDAIARLGGDEFTILLTRLKQAEDADAVARRILEVISRPYVLKGREIAVTASVGIAVYPRDGERLEDLLKRSDDAMYLAKAQGKNTYRHFSSAAH